jgi:hypothetical protein
MLVKTLSLDRSVICFSAYAECNWDEKMSHAEYRECLQSSADKTEREVAASQTALQGRIEHWDQEANYKQGALKSLKDSGLRFSEFKAAQCSFEASAAAEGNGAGDIRLACEDRLNQSYVGELQRR